MIIGYIRVSKNTQHTGNQRNTILEYANRHKLIIDEFIEIEISSQKSLHMRKIDELLGSVSKNDTIIIAELSRLGRSISEVIAIVNQIIASGSELISIKENIQVKEKHSMQTKVMVTMFSLIADLERDLISERTKEALAARKAAGKKLGRPPGPGKSKLEPYLEQIQEFIDKKVSMLSISKILEVSYSTLFNFVKRRDLKARGKN
jgi:DNA invertase Pin-like site-specific DNA recombinase